MSLQIERDSRDPTGLLKTRQASYSNRSSFQENSPTLKIMSAEWVDKKRDLEKLLKSKCKSEISYFL